MKFIVIGEPCVDLIHKSNGEIIHSYGGILYSVISLAVISGNNHEVFPVMNTGEDEYENIVSILKRYKNINTEGVYKVNHPTRKVHLYYNYYNSGKSARIEQSTFPTYILDFKEIKDFLKIADAILVNMISGVDITLDTLKNIRENFDGFIHMDVHNLVMKTNDDGSREHTSVKNWLEWCTVSDTIQMNEYEISVLSEVKKTEYEMIEEILTHSSSKINGVIITRGINGVTGYSLKEKVFGNEKFYDLDKISVAAVENPRFVDSTGCGDVFASSFMYDYTINKDFKKGLHFANRIASYNTGLEGIDELYKLR